MNNLLIVVPMCTDDAPMAERLIDWTYQLSGRKSSGHALLAYAHDVHAEYRAKLRISAELAFSGVSEFQAKPPMKTIQATKVECVNNLFHQTAFYVAHHYRWPWLWLEPDCVPMTPHWHDRLAIAYADQPRKFMGRRMKRKLEEGDQIFIARTAIYHAGAWNELRMFNGTIPFEWDAAQHMVSRTTGTKLIQQGRYNAEAPDIDQTAVLYHSDKTGALIEQLRETVKPSGNGFGGMESTRIPVVQIVDHMELGSATRALPISDANITLVPKPEKIDGRSKAARAMKQKSSQ